jgi:hypothetical protein
VTVQLPFIPRSATLTPHLVRVGGDLTSTLGGPTQRITRIGTRYSADVSLPPLDADCAAQWLACMLEAEASGDTLSLPMPQMIPEAKTLPPLYASGSAGSNLMTFAGGVRPPVGAWLSILVGGRNYLHFVTALVGATQASVGPLLRATFPDGTAIQCDTPLLEGFVADTSWSVEFFRFVGHTFTITESA